MNSKEIYLRLLGHVKPYWKQFSLAVLAMLVLAATEPAIPALLKPLLDGTFVEQDSDHLNWTPIALVVLFLVRGVFTFASSILFEWISGRLVLDLRRLMMTRILSLPSRYYDSNSTGSIINKVTFNVSQVTTAATRVLLIVVKDSLSIIGLIGYMLWLNWRLTTLVFILIPVVWIVVRVVAIRMRRLSRQLQERMGDMTHALEEAARGQAVIKVFGGQVSEMRRFDRLANWVRRYHFKLKVAGSAHTPVIEGVGAMMIAMLVYFGTSGELTVGGFVSFLTALGLLFPPVKRLTSVNEPLQRGLAAAESVFDLIDEASERDEGTRTIQRARGRIEFKDVTFRYLPDGPTVLDHVSFVVEPGKTLALVGPSGGGKTTIAHLVPRFYGVESGQILLDGVPIEELTLASLRQNLSVVGQDPMLFNDTVAANMQFGRLQPSTKEELARIARMAHALEFINQLPERFDALIGEDGVLLSGGQRQRLAIARAMLKDAPILILDEATSALDTESERHVQTALRDLAKHRTTLVIAHRLSTIEHADKILVIKAGQVVECGSHESLLSQGGVYTQLYRNQFEQQEEQV